ncbi:MAG TPA: response regulator, partial [Pyrinomonadaceae bacterium]|nr:response regulator [Pyrinomonadaceae bacterium]
FRIRLPLLALRATTADDAPAPAPHARHAPPPDRDRARLDGLRVLVVDDDRDTRDLLSALLRESGAEVSLASSAAEALEHFRRDGPPDLLLSDIGMPEEDGYELVRRVRALPPDAGGRTPAVALTAYARAEDRRQALDAGYEAHLPKPVEPAELTSVLARLAARA